MSYVAVAGIGVSLVTSVIGGARAKKEAQKQKWSIEYVNITQSHRSLD